MNNFLQLYQLCLLYLFGLSICNLIYRIQACLLFLFITDNVDCHCLTAVFWIVCRARAIPSKAVSSGRHMDGIKQVNRWDKALIQCEFCSVFQPSQVVYISTNPERSAAAVSPTCGKSTALCYTL